MHRVLVTGGAGFIGSNLVRQLLATDATVEVIVLDKLTYAGSLRSLADLAGEPRLRFIRGDIADRGLVRSILHDAQPDSVVHLAAESHVDRSIAGPDEFIRTNIVGTFHLLEEVRHYLAEDSHARDAFRFLHASTDEVFGELGPGGHFVETSPYAPRSPYSASKASSDHLVAAYLHTYGVPAITTNCGNNYGPYQFPEKLIPVVIANALAERPLPVYGHGANVRDWIHVADHCAALRAVLAGGRIGERYLAGARCERTNLEVVHTICDLLDELHPRTAGAYRSLIELVADRPGHDFRYAIDPTKLETELGWRPTIAFADGLRRTVEWYLAHPAWVAAIELAR